MTNEMVRVVKLTFQPEHADGFIDIFDQKKERIRAMEGCLSLRLIRDRNEPTIFMTYSVWEGPEHLQNYRRSEFFKDLWTTVTPMFSDKPQAWSLDVLSEL